MKTAWLWKCRHKVKDTLKSEGMIPENDPLSVITGYFESADSMIPVPDIQDKDIRLAKTAFIVGPEKNYTALVAVRKSPRITLSDVQKTIPKGKSLEILQSIVVLLWICLLMITGMKGYFVML